MTHLSTRKHVLALVLTTFCFLCVPHTFVHASNSKYARQRRRQQERQRQSQPKQQKQARSSVCSKPRQNTGCVGGEQWLVVSEGKSHYSAQRAQALCMDACARASELKKGNTCCFFKGTACYLKPGASVVTNVPAEFRGGMSAVCQYRPSETPTVSFVVNITLQCLCQAAYNAAVFLLPIYVSYFDNVRGAGVLPSLSLVTIAVKPGVTFGCASHCSISAGSCEGDSVV